MREGTRLIAAALGAGILLALLSPWLIKGTFDDSAETLREKRDQMAIKVICKLPSGLRRAGDSYFWGRACCSRIIRKPSLVYVKLRKITLLIDNPSERVAKTPPVRV